MLDRRTVLAGSAAGALALPLAGAKAAKVAAPIDRGAIGTFRRMPSADAEARLDFLWGLENYNETVQAPAAERSALARIKAQGIDPAKPMPMAQAVALLGPDPSIALRHKTYLDTERLKMTVVRDAYAADEPYHIAAMDKAMARGPGSLTLDPDFKVPDYARHELHMQPGGYVGDPFAGAVFRHAITGLSSGHNFQNETHESLVSVAPVPADGRVMRTLDLGCGTGQIVSAMHKRFPAAEIWGVDTSAPMLRFAHMEASEFGRPLHFSQQSAEALRFPDGHFDMVTASGLFHEISDTATRRILSEVARVLRPGGTFFPLDLNTGAPIGQDVRSQFGAWLSYRWFHEDWRLGYTAIDLPAQMRAVGLDVAEKGAVLKLHGHEMANMIATKPV